jgi:transposase
MTAAQRRRLIEADHGQLSIAQHHSATNQRRGRDHRAAFRIEALKARLAKLLRATFGRSSEKLHDQVEQLTRTLADIDEILAETVPPDESSEADTVVPGDRGRRPLPEALPRDVITHATPCTCPGCGGVLRLLGEEATEILEYVPGSFRVVRHVRPKLFCWACETIALAPAPNRLPIRRGRAGPGLLADVLVAKYCDHLSLHRRAEIYARKRGRRSIWRSTRWVICWPCM